MHLSYFALADVHHRKRDHETLYDHPGTIQQSLLESEIVNQHLKNIAGDIFHPLLLFDPYKRGC